MNDSPMTARNPEVQVQLNDLNNAIGVLGDLVSGLRKKVHPVLHSRPDEPKPLGPSVSAPLAPLAEELRNCVEKVGILSRDIEDMIQECEL